MKGRKLFITVIFSAMMLIGVYSNVKAQCSMCTTSVETNNASGAKTTKGLNNGIFFLLSAPYLAVAVVGYIWYKKYRRKNVDLQMRNEKLHLN